MKSVYNLDSCCRQLWLLFKNLSPHQIRPTSGVLASVISLMLVQSLVIISNSKWGHIVFGSWKWYIILCWTGVNNFSSVTGWIKSLFPCDSFLFIIILCLSVLSLWTFNLQLLFMKNWAAADIVPVSKLPTFFVSSVTILFLHYLFLGSNIQAWQVPFSVQHLVLGIVRKR